MLDLVSFCEAFTTFTSTLQNGERRDLVGERVRAVVTERQNELLEGINSMLSARFDIMEKSFGEKQSAISENQISRLRSSALGQYQFKRKSCEEQFHFNASVEDKFSDIDCSLSNLNAESVERAKKNVAEGKSLIQQRQKMLKLVDSSELGWKVVSEYQSNPLASNSDDERKIYKAEVRAERKARKDQQKRLRLKRSSFRGRQSSITQPMQLQSQAIDKPVYRTATTMGGRPGNCWHCGGHGHWRSECEALKKAQVNLNNKISSFHFSDSLFSTQLAPCFDYDIKATHESTAGMKNKSTITESLIRTMRQMKRCVEKIIAARILLLQWGDYKKVTTNGKR